MPSVTQQAPPRPSDSASSKDSSSNEKPLAAGVNGVSLPVCTYMPVPPMTKEARAAKFHGVVLLDAVVELDGRITKIRVIKGAGLGLDESAMNTLKKWKCKPALKDGQPVLADIAFQFRFDST
jgi:protein TonB